MHPVIMDGMIVGAAQIAVRAGDVAGNAALHLRYAEAAAAGGARLLVFPELSLMGYELGVAREHVVDPSAAVLDALREVAARSAMHIVVGAPLAGPDGGLHIGAIVLRADGGVSTYRKVHVHASELGVFAPGPGGDDLRMGQASVALAICADASQPQHAAEAAGRGAAVYAVGAMIDEGAYARKSALLEGYARGHGMAVLLANYAGETGGEVSGGRSAVWREDGGVVAMAQGREPALVVALAENGVWRGFVQPMVGCL
ncbi:MAG: carbon-nitrogen hydrolase family protein [Bryobacterales bacterium]|nr:carbon-nitrogen hydrolase family protein [Bryobacterales bacterium]